MPHLAAANPFLLLIFHPRAGTTLLLMKRAFACVLLILAPAFLFAQSNLRIEDVGLHGYWSSPVPVSVTVRNPSPQTQSIHLQLSIDDQGVITGTVSTEVTLNGDEVRRFDLPLLLPMGNMKVLAEASAGGVTFARDSHPGDLRLGSLVVLMCADDSVCKTAQSQIQFSGSIEDRANKNRQLTFETVNDFRADWWAYMAAKAIVLARPTTALNPAQRAALEGYLRSGGRLILVENEIGDSTFLSAYRKSMPPDGEHVSKGTLFRVSSLTDGTLGNIFTGGNLALILNVSNPWEIRNVSEPLRNRFATTFQFPHLRWVLLWLAIYILVIGIVNFSVLRRLRRLEYGWVSMCGIAILFSAGFYFSGASHRPTKFILDNLATYSLDSRSPLAAAEYHLRLSTPTRREVNLSIADSAVFMRPDANVNDEESSQIWAEMNRKTTRATEGYDIRMGPPREVDLPLLKWSFRDLDMRGLREFPGTVHFVGPNRLRNDTGQRFSEAVYLDYETNTMYPLPPVAAGAEIDTTGLKGESIRTEKRRPDYTDPNSLWLESFFRDFPAFTDKQVFAGFADGPGLPAELNVAHANNVHSLIVVALEQP